MTQHNLIYLAYVLAYKLLILITEIQLNYVLILMTNYAYRFFKCLMTTVVKFEYFPKYNNRNKD